MDSLDEERCSVQQETTFDDYSNHPSTSGTNTTITGQITGNITAHEEALESHPLLDGSRQDHSVTRSEPARQDPRVDVQRRNKRRSLSLLVHTGSVHTLKLSPKKRRRPQGYFDMSGLPPPVPSNPTPPPLDYNLFTTKQTIGQGLLLASLLMCNASQLKTLVVNGYQYHFFRFVTTFIVFSILAEVMLGVLLLFLGRDDITDVYVQRRLDRLNNTAVFIAFIIVILNVFVAAFGLVAA